MISWNFVNILVRAIPITSMINTFSNTSVKIFSTMKMITSYKNIYLNKELEKLDVECRINQVRSLLVTIDKPVFEKNKPIKIAIHNLNDIVDKIDICLMELNKKVCSHSEKWFNSWRGFNYIKHIKKLKNYLDILERRWAILINLFKIKYVLDEYV